jgi:hypothetical protein
MVFIRYPPNGLTSIEKMYSLVSITSHILLYLPPAANKGMGAPDCAPISVVNLADLVLRHLFQDSLF